jgi:endonuclease/exonuclease/phosphatase family metal-dependent hydrolase
MAMRKRVLKILAGVGIGIPAVILAAPAGFHIHPPRCLGRAQTLNAEVAREDDDVFTVMSYNVRYRTGLDRGKKNWEYRAGLVTDNIVANTPDIIGFQEVTPGQYDYFAKALAGYESVVEYRDDTPFSEGCPVFYNALRYKMIESGSFWLSETPGVMSKDWGAANYRICTCVVLRERVAGARLAVFNTHLDHVSDEARINGIRVILDKMEALTDVPAILMGDLNAEEDSKTYAMVTGLLTDAKYAAAETMGGNTFQGWGKVTGGSPIDYVMLTPGAFAVARYKIDTTTYKGVYPSDHYPLCVDLSMRKEESL